MVFTLKSPRGRSISVHGKSSVRERGANENISEQTKSEMGVVVVVAVGQLEDGREGASFSL